MRSSQDEVVLPFRAVAWRFHVCLLFLLCGLTWVERGAASPGYLLDQLSGKLFSYISANNTSPEFEHLTNDSANHFMYIFTEEMNVFARQLMEQTVTGLPRFNAGGSLGPCAMAAKTSDDTGSASSIEPSYPYSYCPTVYLQIGMTNDCLTPSPLCCVLYWRFPPSLPSRMPSDLLDPRLVFWDGTKAVNGFYVNFTEEYRRAYSSCALTADFPDFNATLRSKTKLSVDVNGEWRFSNATLSFRTYVEHEETSMNTTLKAEIELLAGAAQSTWRAALTFGDVPMAAPIAVTASLLGVLFLMLLLLYLCSYKPAMANEAAWHMKIQAVQEKTAATEARLSALRQRGDGYDPDTLSRSHGSFSGSRPSKISPSPPNPPDPFSSSLGGGDTSQYGREYIFPAQAITPGPAPVSMSRTPSGRRKNGYNPDIIAGLSAQGGPSETQCVGSFTLSRKRGGPENRRPLSHRGGGAYQDSMSPTIAEEVAAVTEQQQAFLRRCNRSNTSVSSAQRRQGGQNENPLLGRQTFQK